MRLTKENITEIAEHMEQMKRDDWAVSPVGKDELAELLRGYKKYLAEVEEHEKSIKFLHNIGADGGPAEEYHISRLAALKGEG